MGILQIRADLAALVAANMPDLAQVTAYPPGLAAVLPAAWLGEATTESVIEGSREVWTWLLPLTIAVARSTDYGVELSTVEPMIDAVLDAIRSDFTLGNTTAGVVIRSAREGVVKIGGEDYAAVTLTFGIKQYRNISYT